MTNAQIASSVHTSNFIARHAPSSARTAWISTLLDIQSIEETDEPKISRWRLFRTWLRNRAYGVKV